MTITTTHVEEFKEDNRISHSSEDKKITRMLEASYADIQSRCGAFDIDTNPLGKDLVFQQTRYRFNDMLEYFYDNFLSEIHSLGISLIDVPDEVV
ncbi:hypothetical protein ERX27_07480 [Macrococcus brunensis]|uniref:Phage gp6-like head-tail connector protein n=1 Tax=Macrococcus brunensis TaxID=198483 RepID=A0A4R6BCY9_9STAP|nr:hypothetical protein [Macrococcus brunensis]TDL96687.1 hypothetical protein ERX27_07480 [Macrococcus brunensis]